MVRAEMYLVCPLVQSQAYLIANDDSIMIARSAQVYFAALRRQPK